VHYQALHHFVAASPWDPGPVRRRLAEVLTAALEPTAWVIDDTGFPKDGTCSVGVQRHAAAVLGHAGQDRQLPAGGVGRRGHRAGLLPTGLAAVVPERWDEDVMATRRAACHLPGQVHHRPKWQLVLDMLDALAGFKLHPPVLLADCGYGEVGCFRGGLDARQVPYVVEVRSDTSAYPEQIRPTVPPFKGRGRRPRPRYRDKPSSLKELAMAAGQQACVDVIWRRGSKALQRGRFLAVRVHPAGVTPRRLARQHGGELPVRWLLVEWPLGKAEPTKYWRANLPESTPLVELVGLARLRWRVEQDYRELKGALGLDHFEGRGWPGWHHHVTLVSVAHGFLTLERLRRPKPAASA
jgi:SRSO17 transposase